MPGIQDKKLSYLQQNIFLIEMGSMSQWVVNQGLRTSYFGSLSKTVSYNAVYRRFIR